MNFKLASTIVRSHWLVDKQWADGIRPSVIAFLRGKTSAKDLFGDDDDDDSEIEDDDNETGELVQGTANVYEVKPGTDLSKLPADCIAFVDIDGPMMKDGGWCSYGMCDYAELMTGLKNNPNVAAVIIDIDSPGGQVDGTATLADAIAACRDTKQVIGYIDDAMAASAAYWCISACSEIYCSQSTDQAGSIGVYCTVADWNKYYENEGLPVHDVYAPQSDEKNLTYRKAVEGDDSLLKADLGFIADAFIGAVKANRKGKIVGTDWAKGKMYYAKDAIAQGLIDGIMSFEKIVARINKTVNTNKKILKQNTMVFEKTLKAASATKFAVVDDGFLLEEAHLNNLEAALETATADAALVVDLKAQLATATTAKTTAETSLATATTEIGTLKAKVATLEKGDGARFTQPKSEGDKNTPEAEAVENEFGQTEIQKQAEVLSNLPSIR